MPSLVNFDITLTNLSQRTGRYNLASTPDGDVSMDGTQAYAVQTAVGCIRGAWWADETVGSEISTLQNLTSRTPAAATAAVLQALDPLVALSLISDGPKIYPPFAQVGIVNLLQIDVDYTTPGSSDIQQTGFQF